MLIAFIRALVALVRALRRRPVEAAEPSDVAMLEPRAPALEFHIAHVPVVPPIAYLEDPYEPGRLPAWA